MRKTLSLSCVVAWLLTLGLGVSLAAPLHSTPVGAHDDTQDAVSAGTGSLVVRTVDPAGTPVTNRCFELRTDAGGGARGAPVADGRRCDAPRDPTGLIGPEDGRVDGSLSFTGLAPGRYVLVEVPVNDRYEPIADQPVVVTAGAISSLTLTHFATGALTLYKVDAAGAPLAGACFGVVGTTFALCDGAGGPGMPSGDGKADGILLLPRLDPTRAIGTFTLRELWAPAGYAPVPDQTFTTSTTTATKLTVANALASGSGGGAGGLAIELEIDSKITVRQITGYLVVEGVASASGRIGLEGNPETGIWHGVGTLVSKTTSGRGGCGSIHIEGEGAYDWVVREAVVSPGIAAEQIVVHMDSGPIAENPDKFEIDACPTGFDGLLNTWENSFFQVHRADFKAKGFEVGGWTLQATEATWQTGGLIATASWTGSCGSTPIVDCTDDTTFRLYAVVTGPLPTPAPSAGSAPSASLDSSAPSSAPLSSLAVPSPASLASSLPVLAAVESCGDLEGCFQVPAGVIAAFIAAVLAAAAIATALWLRARSVEAVPGSGLDYDALDYGKILPDAEPLDYGKHPPDA